MQDFDAQAEALRASIEQELEDDALVFPTSLDLSLRIKQLADDAETSLDEIAKLVIAEPVLSARLMRLASSVALNPSGNPVHGVMEAIRRVGLSTLRSTALSVAAEQLARDQRSRNMRIVASGLWAHSVDVASWAHALSRETRVGNTDAALFAGMMVNIGQFFVVARAAAFPAMEEHIDRFAACVAALSGPVSRQILARFALSDATIHACSTSPSVPATWPPATLADIIAIAQCAAAAPNPIRTMAGERKPRFEEMLCLHDDLTPVAALLDAARPAQTEMRAALRD